MKRRIASVVAVATGLIVAGSASAQFTPPAMGAVPEVVTFASVAEQVLTIGAAAIVAGLGVYVAFRIGKGLIRWATSSAKAG